MVSIASPGQATRRTRRARPRRPPTGIRPRVAVGIARVITMGVGIAHHQGTALPGLAAERVWPDGLAALAGQLRSTVLVVGTNGKTTTAGLIAEVVRRADGRPIANRSGANMRQAIMTSLVGESDLSGRIRRDDGHRRTAVFEVDELALELILPDVGPSIIVATNLFRDQLDRYGEADTVADRWTAALETAAEGSILVHCADDPRLAMLAARSPLPTLTFGLAGAPPGRDQRLQAGGSIADPVACRTCGRQLVYSWRSVGHLGAFACPDGHLERLPPDVAIEAIPPTGSDGDTLETRPVGPFRISGPLGEAVSRSPLLGLPNAYNVAAALAAGAALGHDLAGSARATDGWTGSFGRLERMVIDGRHVILILIKNTVSLAETDFLAPSLGADVVLLGLNDAAADGRDVSWIWDAPIGDLVAGRAVVLAGARAADLHLRLKYDGDPRSAPPRSVEEADTLRSGLDTALRRTPRGGTIVAAATYTAMMGLRTIAERRGVAPPAPR